MAFLAVVRHSLFAFDHPAFTAEVPITATAVTNQLNIGVALITINTAIYTANFARMESITVPDTAIAPKFPITAIVAASSFGDAVQASNLPTMSTLFRIHASQTEPLMTGSTALRPTTVKTVTPVANAAQVTHTINPPLILFRTLMTVVSHAIIAGDKLCSIICIMPCFHD